MNQSTMHELVTPTLEECKLLEAVRGEELPSAQEDVLEMFARVAWARLVEPGDRVATLLLEVHGAATSLAHVIAGSPVERMLQGSGELPETPVQSRELSAALERWRPRLDRAATVQDLLRARQCAMRLLVPSDALWPTQLNDLAPHQPLTLWVRGNHEYLSLHSVAIVGARACSAYGQQVTAEITQAVLDRQLSVISGGAYGIDGVAHRAALAAGGITVAVLAGGADRLYPQAHDQLLRTIIDRGVVVAEPVPGTPPSRWRFLQRNRLIAALSRATVVTEAGVRSGSINTAGHAAQLGRGLAAVPGPISSAGSHGCFRIINEFGAMMFTRMTDLDAVLGFDTSASASAESSSAEPARQTSLHQRTLDALPLKGSRSTAAVARRAGLSIDEACVALTELELLGSVCRTAQEVPREASWKIRPDERVK